LNYDYCIMSIDIDCWWRPITDYRVSAKSSSKNICYYLFFPSNSPSFHLLDFCRNFDYMYQTVCDSCILKEKSFISFKCMYILFEQVKIDSLFVCNCFDSCELLTTFKFDTYSNKHISFSCFLSKYLLLILVPPKFYIIQVCHLTNLQTTELNWPRILQGIWMNSTLLSILSAGMNCVYLCN